MSAKQSLLLVDDDELSLEVLGTQLDAEFEVAKAADGEHALALLEDRNLPDLILLDVEMPGIDGFEACERIKSHPRTKQIPVIFLTSHGRTDEITRGFASGAVDFIAKPVIPEVLLARVRTHLRLTQAHRQLEYQNTHLEEMVLERTIALHSRTEELLRAQELSIVALGSLAEIRDNETGDHIYRTQEYVRAMAAIWLLPRRAIRMLRR